MVERDRKHDAKKQRGRLDEGKLRASLEWNPEGDPNTQSPSNCGYPYGAPAATATLSGTRMYSEQTVLPPSCPEAEISGTLVREE